MKYLFALLFINVFTFSSLAQETTTESSASISKVEVQGLNYGKARVKVWINTGDVESLDFVKMQFSGAIIPRMTVLATLKQTSSIISSNGGNMIVVEGEITVNNPSPSGSDTIRYVFKKSGPTNFRAIKPGSVIYLPPIQK